MKKLMIGLFAICAAVGAQAAYVDWQYQGNNAANDTSWGDSKTSAANGYTAYLLTATAWDSIKTTASGASDIASKALDSSTLIYDKTTKSKMYYTTHADGGTTASARQVSVANATDNYYVILANDSGYSVVVENASITGYSDPSSMGTGLTPGLTKTSQNNVTMISNNSNAYPGAAAIPEPTSGLLMLVGLGALALRRRRA